MKLNEAIDNALATVTGFGFGETLEEQKPYLFIDFKLDEAVGDNGEELTTRGILWLTDAGKGFDHTLKVLSIVFEWKGENIFEFDKESAGPKFYDITGKKARLTVEMQEYKGKSEAKVKWINSAEHKPKIIARESLKALSDKLKGKVELYRAKESGDLPF